MDLTLDPGRRAERALAAAEARYLAGSGKDALRLAALAERGLLNEPQRVRVDVLRGRVATMQRRPRDAPPLGAAQRPEDVDRTLARDTYRDAFIAAIYAGRFAADTGLSQVAAAIRSAAPSAGPPSATDQLLDAAALLVDAGYETGAAAARRALPAFRVMPISGEHVLLTEGLLRRHQDVAIPAGSVSGPTGGIHLSITRQQVAELAPSRNRTGPCLPGCTPPRPSCPSRVGCPVSTAPPGGSTRRR